MNLTNRFVTSAFNNPRKWHRQSGHDKPETITVLCSMIIPDPIYHNSMYGIGNIYVGPDQCLECRERDKGDG
jgi:hypothetical protein